MQRPPLLFSPLIAAPSILMTVKPSNGVIRDPARQHRAGIEEIVDLHMLPWIVAAMFIAHKEHAGWNTGRRKRRSIVRCRTSEPHGRNAEIPRGFLHLHDDSGVNHADARR